MPANSIANRYPASVAAALFVGFAILCGVASYILTDVSKNIQKAHTFKNLQGIGELKVGQIGTYFQERKGDALVVARFLGNPAVAHWLASPSGNVPAAVRQMLETAVATYRYGGLLLLDSKANIRFGTGQYREVS